jgi:hypothetical protein
MRSTKWLTLGLSFAEGNSKKLASHDAYPELSLCAAKKPREKRAGRKFATVVERCKLWSRCANAGPAHLPLLPRLLQRAIMDVAFRKIDIDQYDEDVLLDEELYEPDVRDPATVLADAKEKQAAVRSFLAKWVPPAFTWSEAAADAMLRIQRRYRWCAYKHAAPGPVRAERGRSEGPFPPAG